MGKLHIFAFFCLVKFFLFHKFNDWILLKWMKKFRHFTRLNLSRSHLSYGLNFCMKLTPKISKMRKFPTDGLMKCFQLILIVCLYGSVNWKSKESPKRRNKFEHLKNRLQLTLHWKLPHITYYLLNKFWNLISEIIFIHFPKMRR